MYSRAENPFSHKYILGNCIKTCSVRFDKLGLSLRKESQKFDMVFSLNLIFNEVSVEISNSEFFSIHVKSVISSKFTLNVYLIHNFVLFGI